ncbi:gluzincin family metallopeptidase [Acuticoccus mangrovi]|uniref:Peptidase M4 n=1 Tax=Acuticoccus mangrovi TaxID=2796142 RepID=A0A934II36_9HYPH|nr:hypothetical protein [Acuticoccus mangrovi]MBJ3777124.1 hypothetical protein [Acuticoccus mangrovi]
MQVEISDNVVREAGLDAACYAISGNVPRRLRRGEVFTVDPSLRMSEAALSSITVPYERLMPGPAGGLFAVDAVDRRTHLMRSFPDLDRMEDFRFDQGDPESHCRNAYLVAMETYEAFRMALGRPVAWGFWREGHYPPLSLAPFAFDDLNAYYDRRAGEICFGFSGAGPDHERADARLIRFTALSSDVVVHEVTHALLDGLRPGFDRPVNPDVLAFHEAFADIVALLSRFRRPGYVEHLMGATERDILADARLISLAPELGALIRQSGLRTLDVEWTTAGRAEEAQLPRYVGLWDGEHEPHARGGLLASAVFEAFMRSLRRRARPLAELAAGTGPTVRNYLARQIADLTTRTARHYLAMCVRAIDYCPPASINFSDYLRALVTADRILVPADELGYREDIVDAFRRRGIYPPEIDVVSDRALAWDLPDIPLYPIPGLALADLRFVANPTSPRSAREIRRQARALALAIEADPNLWAALRLRPAGDGFSPPRVESLRPTLRTGPGGLIDFEIIAEIVQDRAVPVGGTASTVRLVSGSTLILDASGTPKLIVWQRGDSQNRFDRETEYAQRAIAAGWLRFDEAVGEYVVDDDFRSLLCSGGFKVSAGG